jgi:putative phage-type endonuclease
VTGLYVRTGRPPAVELLAARDAHPDNPLWHEIRRQGITATEAPIIAGLVPGPWASPFSLWWQKRNGWRTDDNVRMRRGRRMQALVAEDFAEGHTNPVCASAGLYAHPTRWWELATPDLLTDLMAPVELKTAVGLATSTEWGPDGSDIVPVQYRAQQQWQMDVMGSDHGWLYAFDPSTLEARSYRIRYDRRDVTILLTLARQFRTSLARDTPPEVDGRPATARALSRLHPDIVDTSVEIPADLAAAYRRHKALAARVDAFGDRLTNRILQRMGSARRVVCDGTRIASRSITANGNSKLQPTRGKRAKP